jgi:hypothetical protein
MELMNAGLLSLSLVVAGTAATVLLAAGQAPPDRAQLDTMTARFAPTDISADLSKLPDNERQALSKLVAASRLMDAIFLRQVWAGNVALLTKLVEDSSPEGQARLRYFLINKGPWSRLDHNQPFLAGVPEEKPAEANFYPAGATKDQVERWMATLSPDARRKASGFFTTIRRAPAGAAEPFVAVPYSLEYQGELGAAAKLLREAAALTTQPTLKKYLATRGDAFLTDDYYASDVAWMELDASIEPTIGPYEVYADEWFNFKAAFESFIAVRDDAGTAKLAAFGAELQEIEDHLPIDPALRNPKLGALAPIRVVNVIFTAGDGNRGVQTAAYNLPNDERVVKEKGSKRVMLKNVQEAKFAVVLQPIAKVALGAADERNVAFDAFFTHILMHELMHGLGPHNITVGGKTTTVRQELKELYSTIEEAKADISGLWALQHLVDRGKLPSSMADTMYTTFLASTFRSIRFGITEAHGRGVALQLNFLIDHGAVVVGPDGTFSVNTAKMRVAAEALTRQIMTLQANGDYKAAAALVATATVKPDVQRVLDKLAGVPVDIAPRFTTALALEQQGA